MVDLMLEQPKFLPERWVIYVAQLQYIHYLEDIFLNFSGEYSERYTNQQKTQLRMQSS